MSSAILECSNLTKTFGAVTAVDGVTLDIPCGSIVGLLGPNASGKSTFLKLCNKLLSPTSGEVRIAGYKPGMESKRLVSYLPERSYLNDWMKVCDIIDLFADFYPTSTRIKPAICSRNSISRGVIASKPCPGPKKRFSLSSS